MSLRVVAQLPQRCFEKKIYSAFEATQLKYTFSYDFKPTVDNIYYQKKPFNSNNNNDKGGPGRESCSHNLIHKFLGPNSRAAGCLLGVKHHWR